MEESAAVDEPPPCAVLPLELVKEAMKGGDIRKAKQSLVALRNSFRFAVVGEAELLVKKAKRSRVNKGSRSCSHR